MITRIKIPQAFENMEEATIGRWLKREGDAIQNGDVLCELITEKTTFDLPVEGLPEAGVLRQLVASEKSIVPVGFIIALAGDEADVLPDVATENAGVLEKRSASEATFAAPVAVSIAPRDAGSTPATGSRLRATPAARRVAKERGVTMEDVAAAFPGKVLTEDDVLKFDS